MTLWRTFHTFYFYDVILTLWRTLWTHFMRYFRYFFLTFWRTSRCKICDYEVMFDVMRYVLTLWHTFMSWRMFYDQTYLFDTMTCILTLWRIFWRDNVLFDVVIYFLRSSYTLWRYEMLFIFKTSWRIFDVMTYFP